MSSNIEDFYFIEGFYIKNETINCTFCIKDTWSYCKCYRRHRRNRVLAPFILYYIMLCYITLCYVNVMKSASLTNAKEVIPCSLFPRGKSYASTVETKGLLSFKRCWSAAWLLNRDAWLYNLCHFTYPFSLSFLSQILPLCHSSSTVPVSLLNYPT